MDTSKILFRCSGIGDIMTEPRSKSEEFSKTAMKRAIEAYIISRYDRYPKDITSDAIKKGLMVEDDAIDILARVDGRLYMKNEERFSNAYISGTPDIIADDVVDIKSSFDIFTYFASKFDYEKSYEWQLQGYMALTGKTSARLAYVLCDTPDVIIESMKRKAWYDLGSPFDDTVSGKIGMEIERNAKYDLSDAERVHIHHFQYDNDAIERVYQRVADLRLWLGRTFK
jgi:hypothetical protein